MQITEEELEILNSKIGLHKLLSKESLNLSKALRYAKYEM
jgi:hypothetical protein